MKDNRQMPRGERPVRPMQRGAGRAPSPARAPVAEGFKIADILGAALKKAEIKR